MNGELHFSLVQSCMCQFLAGDYEKASRLADQVTELGWEVIHHGDWKDVDTVWRIFFGWGSIVQAYGSVSSGNFEDSMKTLDVALLICGPCHDSLYSCLETLVSLTNDAIRRRKGEYDPPVGESTVTEVKLPGSECVTISIEPSRAIKRLCAPGIEGFLVEHMLTASPVILTGMMQRWPAMSGSHAWSNFNYLKSVAGLRTVPVEVGDHYLSDGWGQELMTLSAFIDRYVTRTAGSQSRSRCMGYLAQTQLFKQIPKLGRDIIVPDFCALRDASGSRESDEEDDLTINAWFGPGGTVSPLHHDPYHNLLSQVVGEKYIRLYHPRDSEKLYPHDSRMLFNTSQVNAEEPDLSRFPMFAEAPYLECVLKPGEMLYIPPKHWHYVRSLSISFSVSFWWG